MKLHQLFSFFDLNAAQASADEQHKSLFEQEVTGLFFDARLVTPGSVFVAIKGNEKDGHQFIDEAIKNGAIAVVVENKSKVLNNESFLVVEAPDTRQFLDLLAARFYNFPSQELFCIGVTGTNGKTSITYILEHILNANNKLTGVMGTINHRVGEKIWNSQMTTPDPVTLQSRLREFKNLGAVTAAMEVSSHALEQKRAESVHFDTVIFTNLTLDHLDYHKTMQSYFQAKQKLFTDQMWSSTKKPKFAVINIDDSYGRKLKVADEVVTWTYGQKESDFQFKILKMSFTETEFELKTPFEMMKLTVPLSGMHTIYNIVASAVAALSCGVPLAQSFQSLKDFRGIPGRLQIVDLNKDKTVFVDYAHTPDALKNVLNSLNEVRKNSNLKNKIITVFGCGGDRDKSKRPLMAKIACELSDQVFITSDNPRTEDPHVIIKEIEHGVPTDFKDFNIEVDREKAIQAAILQAFPGDVILIAGKGHEDYQIIGTEKKYFSDFDVARKYL
ncbi:MAG: UDP-N-acetylmuramoyl-L-alanyl-D-glutamate--2,6-diaminopimelate ligase [Bdellovibrio sp.]|nr:UDP-N-acetylmuramoyl-L-alanyl-D-glutamate--2,6-diaminopimelate ligase [Bdellovibrio sp.]